MVAHDAAQDGARPALDAAAGLRAVLALAGLWTGEGRTAEGESFIGRLEVVPVVEGRGAAVLYRAQAPADADVGGAHERPLLHEEDTLCAPLADGALALAVLCLELPGLQVLRQVASPAEAMVFQDEQTRIRLDRDGAALGYTWARRGPAGWRDVTAVRLDRVRGPSAPRSVSR